MTRTIKSLFLPLCACALVALGGAGCGTQDAAPGGLGQAAQLQAVLDHGSITLPAFSKLVAASADEFIIKQNGADYAADLDWSRCLADSTKADFAPAWHGGGTDPLANAAYSLYRLKLDPTTIPATLTLTWDGAEPQQCWIGLADWATQSWSWQLMPAGGALVLPDPTPFTETSMRCYAAVVVLGSTACTLDDIGYGDLPIPPTGNGYTLFAPMAGFKTFLIDEAGIEVHQWTSPFKPGLAAYLTEDGHLLRQCNVSNQVVVEGGGSGGRLEEYDWDGNLVWSYDLSTTTQCTHHDFRLLPNGDILMIVWNIVSQAVLLENGRNPTTLSSKGLWLDSIIEVQPTLPSGGNIVWEWRVLDHLVQNLDPEIKNYGDPAQHPELIDINYNMDPFVADWTAVSAMDWNHTNAVYWNEHFDQIVLSIHSFSEIWIIDHSTTTAEAAGHTGGTYGHGGDLLYRWGNPFTYHGGTEADQKLFLQHDAQWIGDGLDGAGHILVFNNQAGRPLEQNYSTVVELELPVDAEGNYHLDGSAYGPAAPFWEYKASPDPRTFFSSFISSVQRLPGGNTLVCSGMTGWFFEVDAAGAIKWEYHNQAPVPNSAVFRARRYPLDYPGVAALTP